MDFIAFDGAVARRQTIVFLRVACYSLVGTLGALLYFTAMIEGPVTV
jgi:hypothetical protein